MTILEEPLAVVGRPVPRPDAPDKVRGTARYVDDIGFAGMLHARVVRSPHPHAEIVAVDLEKARRIKGVAGVYTAADIPGQNLIPLIHQDQPMLARDRVVHVGEGVALVAAESGEAAEEALAAVKVKYRKLRPILTIDEAFKKGEIFTHWTIARGSVDDAFREAEVIIEETYYTPYQEHAYLEPNGMLAVPDGMGGIVVYGSLQCPFYVQNAVASVLGIPLHKARVVQMATGGGFGGKEDAPSVPGAMAAMLAWKTGRPVKLIFTREEDMMVMSKRHPGKIRYKSAARRDGTLLAVEIDYFLNGGAYATLSPVVLWRGIIHSAGPYRIPHVRINAYAVRTNTLPCGAFRGFGEPQVVFAAESQIDRLAEVIGIDPLDFRLKNILEVGDETITGHKIDVSLGLREVLEKVADRAGWREKRKRYGTRMTGVDEGTIGGGEGRPDGGTAPRFLPHGGLGVAAWTPMLRRGIGLACCYYGVGLGARGKHLNPAGASVVVAPDGSVTVAVGTTEIGQGMFTVLSQIAAETLGSPMDLVRIVEPDTSRVPESGPTVASRTTIMSGNAIRDACLKIRARMDEALPGRTLPFREAVRECVQRHVHLAAHGWAVPPQTTFDEKSGQGDAYITYTWSANIVELEVDPVTGEVRVIEVVSGHDVGKVINPQTGEGQIEGGVVQGLGYALTEEHHIEDGRILNDQFSTYIIPVSLDNPHIVPIIVEHPFPWGPYGAKGLGETPIIAVAPAVTNAIAHAVGARLTEIPATPERVWEALRRARDGTGGDGVDGDGGGAS